jgi:hypothetical protein
MEDIKTWKERLQYLLNQLDTIDLGYPVGENEVSQPLDNITVEERLRHAGAAEFDELREFYAHFDGLSLPDIHIGYFIKSVTQLGDLNLSSEPVRINGEYSDDILPFGSTGGGGLFVLRKATRDVLHLRPGLLEDGLYDATRGRADLIADSFFEFLDFLLADVQAFIENQTGHRFLC